MIGWYSFVLGYVLYGSSSQASGYFAIYLKAEHFSIVERNIIPTGTNLISAFCVVLVRHLSLSLVFQICLHCIQWGFGSDYTGSRIAFIIGPLVGVPDLAFSSTGQQAVDVRAYS